MSDLDQNFEFILKQNRTKRPSGLYSDNKQENKHTFKPQDVISSVSKQLKAIQVADAINSEKSVSKHLLKYNKTNFLSVNNLPVYEEVQKTKFDTQCVSDTELFNIIEDAEINDVHRGMTQEFETSFIHHTEKQSLEDDDDEIMDVEEQIEDNRKVLESNENRTKDIPTVDSDQVNKDQETGEKDKTHVNITKAMSSNGILDNNIALDTSLSIISPIMCSNNVIEINTDMQNSQNDNTQLEENNEIFNECIDIDDESDMIIERPVSPIFLHKNPKPKSKTPSPLIFNLEKFEQFEKIAIPILEGNELKKVRQVINSQILNKELNINMNEEIFLNNREVLSPVLQNKDVNKAHSSTTELKSSLDSDTDTDLEFIELDKATSDDLINQINENATLKPRSESAILKDEILFSSDEEDYVQKSFQDLPFTCALETSFYNQTDVLDKTMYVGFQTASNKSIQIFTESFSQAKSILSGVVGDELTVTDLVKNCDIDTVDIDATQAKIDLDDGKTEAKLGQHGGTRSELQFVRTLGEPKDLQTQAKMDLDHEETEFNVDQNSDTSKVQVERNISKDLGNVAKSETNDFEGFMTASKKTIKLSQKSLARCKKVFHDIDLSQNFDVETEEEHIDKDKLKTQAVTDATNKRINKDLTEEDIQTIDDVIMQEFENIEMSLKEDQEPGEYLTNVGFKTAGNKEIGISETALNKIKDVFKDVDFDEESELNVCNTNDGKKVQMLSNSTGKNFSGFKTASNKNIKLSEEALAKTKNIFKDIDSIVFPNKSSKNFEQENLNFIDSVQPSTSKETFVGFKTANNKDIKISEQALANTKNIFNDLGTTKFPDKKKKDCQENSSNKNFYNQPSPNQSFIGFKTANNKNINISKEALENSKKMFDGIDSTDFILPTKRNRDFSTENTNENVEDFVDFNQPSTSKCSFIGFKTANNKNIQISEAELAKTKNIFKDIDITDKEENVGDEAIYDVETKVAQPRVINPSFKGFKTASDKEIKISDSALAKTRNIFKDIDSQHFKYPSKSKGDYKEIKSDKDIGIVTTEKRELNMPPSSTASFGGFKTANNKKINISKEALAKTKNIFQDIDAANFKYPGKYLEPATEENVEQMHNKKILNNDNSTNKSGFVGFKTANNRQITISKESLDKTKNIFKDIDATDFKFPNKVNKDIENDELTENKNNNTIKTNLECEMTDLLQTSTSKASFTGFKTANNRKITISEVALSKTKNIFKDLDSNDFLYPHNPNTEFKEEGNERKSPYPDLKECPQPSTSKYSFVGFKTANNKVINVSDLALAKTKNIFKDVDSTEIQIPETVKKDYPHIDMDVIETNVTNNDFKVPNTTMPKFQGFQTASNKQAKVSAEALVKSRKLFQDIDVGEDFYNENEEIKTKTDFETIRERFNTENTPIDGKTSPAFKGFQTANKKPVAISKEALAKSKKFFQDIETIDEDPEPEFHGFKTANDEEVELYQKALTETKQKFENAIKRSSFKGFQTASDKKVLISEDSLNKSRKIFQDSENKTASIKFGFKTGTNKDIYVSKKAVGRSKRLFSEIDDSNENLTNEDNILDTQVLNNFDESLHTADFHDSPIKSKRSGSPILSCPRAKRRKKFETPYSQKLPKPVPKKKIFNIKDTTKVLFTEDYKKNKRYKLKDLIELSKSNNTEIDPYLLQFTYDSLLQFEFDKSRNDLTNGILTKDLLKELFLNSVNSKLVPNGWIENHLKLILWKLISYEVKFKIVAVTAKNVIDQLKYRYDRELYSAQRPALRKILEKDDVASKTMVLCVAGMYVDGVSVDSATTTNNLELLLTDGWYCIKANIDTMLAQLVRQGRLTVGSKIVTNGAELVNCEQGVSPWEDTSAVRLKLYGNSTRRARWDARLGYHGNGAILSQLSSVKLDGGKVSKLRVFVTRVYPALYVEKFEDGSTVTRSERLEHLHQMKSEAERQSIMEKIYEEVEKEFSDQDSQDSDSLSDLSNKRTCLDSGSQIAKVMKRSKDPAEFRAGLSASQSRLLESHTSNRRDRLLQEIQEKIRDKVEKAGVCVNRNVVTLLKIRVAGVTEKSGVEITKGMMSIWKPTDAVLEIIKEGAWIDVMNVVPTAVRYSEIQISAGRQSVFSFSKYKEPEKFKTYTKLLKRSCFPIKDLAQNPAMSTDYNEIDTAGFIFLIDPSIKDFDSSKQPFQNVFLADADKNIICVNFWGGLKKFGYQNVLDTGQIVACGNLQKRAGNTRKSIPQYRVTEFSYFTKTPKNENARNVVDELSKKFLSLDKRKFCEDCVVLKNNFAVLKLNNENISYRFINDCNISNNKMFIDSPLARPNKIDDNFNLTGLDFESTFKQDTQLSEEVLLRKKKVNEKIARLKMYGEPPPLSTIHIINKSKNATNSYKNPLNPNNNSFKITPQKSKSDCVKRNANFDSSINVASVKETPEKCGNLDDSEVICSPIFMNRTYVKSVNPVKIDFDMKDNNDSNVDHFAEEFDGSPPLSLD